MAQVPTQPLFWQNLYIDISKGKFSFNLGHKYPKFFVKYFKINNILKITNPSIIN